ncbi:MAG: thioredoxin family protein [Granulosicoccaceae bacterium]
MARTPSTMLPLGTALPAFNLPEPRTGSAISSDDFAGHPLVVGFVCNHCPFVVHIWDQFVAFAAEYADKGVNTVLISSNDVESYPADSPEKMAELAHSSGASFPYLYDESQAVAKAFDAACTPDFYIFDAEGMLVYRGQFDAARPGNGEPVDGADMRAALDALLAGGVISDDQKPSMGCNIKWK